MLEFLRGKASDRKLRLFAVACCRRIWHLLTDERSRKAVELAEQSADQPISSRQLDAVSTEAEEASEDAITSDESSIDEKTGATFSQLHAACWAASYASNAPVVRHSDAIQVIQAAADAVSDCTSERATQSLLARDIFGNPFRAVSLDTSWLTSTVVSLATAIYAERDFDRLPILGDALEDAGCTNADILNHCRQPGGHARGCWALDLILGKG
jgi:hypothetical protein